MQGTGCDAEARTSLVVLQGGPGSVLSDTEVPQVYTAAAFNGTDLETGSIFSKDEELGPDEERWRKRFKRRVKVSPAV